MRVQGILERPETVTVRKTANADCRRHGDRRSASQSGAPSREPARCRARRFRELLHANEEPGVQKGQLKFAAVRVRKAYVSYNLMPIYIN